MTAKVIAAAGIKSLVAAKAIYAAAYAATYVATAVALNAASQALMGSAPDMDSGKTSLRQAIPPRRRGYGRRRIGGFYLLWTARANYAYDVIAWHHGRVQGPVEQVWSHDDILVVRSDGWVEGGHGYGAGNNDLIHLETRLGRATETSYPALVAALGASGEWTSAHRGDGLATLGADYRHAKKENLLTDFPNGDPKWSVVAPLSPVWDPRDSAQTRTNPANHRAVDAMGRGNLALMILDFLCHEEGMGEDYEATVAPEIAHWKGEIDICDELVPLRSGGTTKRYWGSIDYALTDDPQDTLDKLLKGCDGRLSKTEAGVWKLWVGKYRPPSVTLTRDDILDMVLAGDVASQEAVTEIVPSFVSEAHKWSLVATDPWTDETDASLYGGGRSRPDTFEVVNINSQVRRLVKRDMSRERASLRGRLDGRLSCVRVLGERWVAVEFEDLEETRIIELQKGVKTAFSRGVVEMPFIEADPNIDAWNPTTEEGAGPQSSPRPVQPVLAAPTISDVLVFEDSIGGATGVRLRIWAGGPNRNDLTWSARWRVHGAVSWVEGNYADLDVSAAALLETGFVSSANLDVQVAYLTGGGSLSSWSQTVGVDATIVTAGAAIDFITQDVVFPITSTVDSISILEVNGVTRSGASVKIEAQTVGGLTSLTTYGVFWRAEDGVEVEEAPAMTHMQHGGWIFLGWQSTADAEGGYPELPSPPGGHCPQEDEPLLLSNEDHTGPGETIRAGDVVPGETWVWTRHERTGAWGAFLVVAAVRRPSELMSLVMRDGRSPKFSPLHRMGLANGKFRRLADLCCGNALDGTGPGTVERVEPAGEGWVIRLTVDDAATFVIDG
ncbi:hypothetical protein, partial [Brevundimonas nasdae]|uniref:hypothetical protein n=1 Tax=Brevundimonas nasdae TaxID=172043 RepID=UPI003F68DF20